MLASPQPASSPPFLLALALQIVHPTSSLSGREYGIQAPKLQRLAVVP